MIKHGILNGSHFQQRYVRNFDGPKQKRPNNRSWLFWKNLLNTFIRNGTDLMLKQRLGKWTKDHSKNGCWPMYTYEDKVFEFHINEIDEKKWTVYYKHGTQLHFEDELDFDEFNRTIATPTKIQLMSNGTQYSVEPVQVEATDYLP